VTPATPSPAIRSWTELTTPEIDGVVAGDPVVILPLAAVEQHGAHLPVGTDLLLGEGLLARAGALLGPPWAGRVFRLPTQAVGTSREHVRHPGTLTLEPETLARVIRELGAGLARSGVRRLLLFNSHGGNRDVLHGPALHLRDEHDMLVVKATYFRFPRPGGVELPDAEWTHGFHGGAVETAMMLHLHPEAVRRDRIQDAPSLGRTMAEEAEVLGPEGAASFAWLAEDLHPGGTVGDARLASEEMGRRLVDGYAASLASVVRDTAAFPLERLA